MKTSEIIKHIYSKTLAMDREVQTRIMTAALDYIITGDMQVEGDTEIFMLECFMPMLDEAKKNDEPLSLKRSAAGKRGAEKRWKKQKSDGKTFAMPSRARGESLSVSIDNLDINNKFLNINIPESDSKLISSENNLNSDNNSDRDKLKSLEDNLENSAQVIEHKQENKVINKKDNPTHAREKNAAAPEIEAAKPPDKKKSGDERFKVPAVDEVAAYCAERGNNVDAHAWWDFYQSNGWMVGKNRMKDWKAAVRTWEQRHKDESKTKDNGNYRKNELLRYGNTKPEDFKGKGHSTI